MQLFKGAASASEKPLKRLGHDPRARYTHLKVGVNEKGLFHTVFGDES
jgi:hypothetical protein